MLFISIIINNCTGSVFGNNASSNTGNSSSNIPNDSQERVIDRRRAAKTTQILIELLEFDREQNTVNEAKKIELIDHILVAEKLDVKNVYNLFLNYQLDEDLAKKLSDKIDQISMAVAIQGLMNNKEIDKNVRANVLEYILDNKEIDIDLLGAVSHSIFMDIEEFDDISRKLFDKIDYKSIDYPAGGIRYNEKIDNKTKIKILKEMKSIYEKKAAAVK